MSSVDTRRARRPSREYSAVFSALAFGAALLVTGVIGLDVSNLNGLARGTRWVSGPIWLQIGWGLGLLALGAYGARRLSAPRWAADRAARERMMKNVGAGKSSGAVRAEDVPRLTSEPPGE